MAAYSDTWICCAPNREEKMFPERRPIPTTLITANYPPQIDLTRTPLAYGHGALPRLNCELKAPELLTRQRALMSLCDYLHDPEHISAAIREGIVSTLKVLLTDCDVTVRHKSTECLYVFAGHAIGRMALLTHHVILPLSYQFDDPEDIVRKNAHMAIELASESPVAAMGIVDCKLVPILVEKLRVECDEIKAIILDTLHFCMNYDTFDALNCCAMKVFNECLHHTSEKIRAKAARDLMDLSVPMCGKDQAVEVQCMPQLVNLLADCETKVRAFAAGAIMHIAITTKGKYTALEANAIEPLVHLVNDEDSEVRVNALKAITCISEAPEGRAHLLNHIQEIRLRIKDTIPCVANAATIACRVITWKP